jgi:DNA processing protein
MYPIAPLPIPPLLREIPDAPKSLTVRGVYPDSSHVFLAVVGSRTYTSYGKQVCETLIAGLRGYPIVIVSGLALGIDGIAHESALRAGLRTVAVPGSGLDDSVLYPATHRPLAREILAHEGALVSEFTPLWKPRPESFAQRNRIMAGMSHAVLVIEAEARSGTLITSRLALEYNRDVLAVPGPIYSATSKGPHMLIQKGACLIQESEDIITALSLPQMDMLSNVSTPEVSEDERVILSLLHVPEYRDVLLRSCGKSVTEANILLASLELKGLIVEKQGKVFRV